MDAEEQVSLPVEEPFATEQPSAVAIDAAKSAESVSEPQPVHDGPSTAAVVQKLEAAPQAAQEGKETELEPQATSPSVAPELVEEIAATVEEIEADYSLGPEAEPARVAAIEPELVDKTSAGQGTEAETEAEVESEKEQVTEPELEPVPETELMEEAEPEPGKVIQLDSVLDEKHETIAQPEAIKLEQTANGPQNNELENTEVQVAMQQDEPINVETVELNESEPVEETREQIETTVEAQNAGTTAAPEAVTQSAKAGENPAERAAPSAPEPEEPAAPAPVPVPTIAPVKHTIKPGDDKNSPFSILVGQVYEGPMDLLLDLIRKQDIDIYDIPIAKITEQFLTYVESMRASEMDLAGEFIYTASLLIHIKSKMLLPRAPSGPDDQIEDPRRELVERLLEHERFKNAAQMLQQKQMLEEATWTNPGIREFKGDEGTEPELAADTVDLARVFQQILDRFKNRPVINVEEDSVTVGQMIQFLARRLNMEDKPIALRKMLAHTHSRRALVAMFLALLELVRLQAILLRQDRLFSEIFIKKHEDFDSVMTDGFLARDDWN